MPLPPAAWALQLSGGRAMAAAEAALCGDLRATALEGESRVFLGLVLGWDHWLKHFRNIFGTGGKTCREITRISFGWIIHLEDPWRTENR